MDARSTITQDPKDLGNTSEPSDLAVRPATADDSPALARLAEQIGCPTSVKVIQDRLAAVAEASNRENVLVATMPEKGVVAWIHAIIDPRPASEPRMEIDTLVVDESLRGRGIGRLLTNHAEEWARHLGVRTV